MTIEKLNVKVASSNEEALALVEQLAKDRGTQETWVVAVVQVFTKSPTRRTFVSYSNGEWVETVDALCIDFTMENVLVDYIMKRAHDHQVMAKWIDEHENE